MRGMEMLFRAIRGDNGGEFKNSHFETFFMIWISNISFLVLMRLVRMVWFLGKIVPFVRWLG
jgi:hypothetical protein